MRLTRAWIVALGLALAACGDALSSREIEDILAGNSIEGKTADNESYWVYFSGTGDIYMYVESTGFTDSGRWRATSSGQYCRAWRQVQKGAEVCFSIRRSGERLEFRDGDTVLAVRLLPGNPQQLPRKRTEQRLPLPS